ncbi:hypothetical protein NQ318_015335 [Aromia moschata]|uniref:Cytochrome P450 n=1 Tax=Aromia moschata TaxID=1265417 RepID=A0AAV8X9Q9_9CUCU|nr:hypothetical protein NQ318_015335 [Aromia moschata]
MFLFLLLAIVAILFYFVKRNFSYWKRLGVPGPKPLILVGNIGNNLIGRTHASEIFAEIYRKYESFGFVGVYRAMTPCLLVRDPELIKNVLVKDFKYFSDNDVFADKEIDPLIGRNPFILKGEEWKKTRMQLSPNFSSGKVRFI